MMKKLSESNIAIVGLARNCADLIANEVDKITIAFSGAASIRWLVIESDSNDETIAELTKLENRSTFEFISLGNLINKYKIRTDRIAYCRNQYLTELRNNKKYLNVDYVVVCDLDGINSKLTSSAVQSCWDTDVEWDACFANQHKAYYDVWALRHSLWAPNDCWSSYKFLINNGVSKYSALNTAVYSRMVRIDAKSPAIEVDSAFGGLGIYKKNVLLASKYDGLDSDNGEICEHVSFHRVLRSEGFRLYIMPSLINGGWNEHSIFLTWFGKLRFFTLFAVRKIVNFIIKSSVSKIHDIF